MAICSRFVSNFRDGSSQYSTRGVPETATRRYHPRTGVAPFDARAAVRGRPRVQAWVLRARGQPALTVTTRRP